MPKSYNINMNLPSDKIALPLLQKQPDPAQRQAHNERIQAWMARPENTRGPQPQLKPTFMSGASFFKSIVMNAIAQVQQSGTTEVLRRTQSIGQLLEIAISNGGDLVLSQADYNFIKSSMSKATGWTNKEEIAGSVLLVDDAIKDAVESE